MESKTVLCIVTYRRVFILDMDKILRDEDHPDEMSSAPPPLLRILDFLGSGLPLAMGLLKLGNVLYMFGGEFRGNGSDSPYFDDFWRREEEDIPPFDMYCLYSRVMGARLRFEEDPPRPVYKLDLTDHQLEPVKLGSMLGPKLYPFVVEIGGRIYVLSKECLYPSGPLFEVWDPLSEKSQALPTPPSLSEGKQVESCHVPGGIIVCWMADLVYNCFNTVSGTWNILKILPSELMDLKVLDVRNQNFFRIPSGNNGRMRHIMGGPEEGACSTIKLEIDISKTQPIIHGFTAKDDVFLADTGEQGEYMCGLVPYKGIYVFGYSLYIFVFQVKKIISPLLKTQWSITYLRRRFYDFTYIKCRDEEVPMLSIYNALV